MRVQETVTTREMDTSTFTVSELVTTASPINVQDIDAVRCGMSEKIFLCN